MSLEIRQEAVTPGTLGEHAAISIAFVVDRILEVALADGGLGGITLTETTVAAEYVKDYDTIEGEGPTHWADRLWHRPVRLSQAARRGAIAVAEGAAGTRRQVRLISSASA